MAATRVDHSLPAPSARAAELQDRMLVFLREHVLPAEAVYLAHRRQAGPDDHTVPPVVEELKKQAQSPGPVEPVPACRVRPDAAGVRADRRAVGLEQRPRP